MHHYHQQKIQEQHQTIMHVRSRSVRIPFPRTSTYPTSIPIRDYVLLLNRMLRRFIGPGQVTRERNSYRLFDTNDINATSEQANA